MNPTAKQVIRDVNADILAHINGDDYGKNWHQYASLDHSHHRIIYNICRHGLFSKFEKPDNGNRQQRCDNAAASYRTTDGSLGRQCDPELDHIDVLGNLLKRVPEEYRETFTSRLFQARAWVHETLRNIRFDPDAAWVGPGETFISLRGFTSPLNKLFGQWTVTDSARIDFLRHIMSHRQLRRGLLFNLPKSGIAKSIEMIHQRYDEKVLRVHGCRFATVPKNNEKDRAIGVEPFGNMMLQKMVGDAIRTCLLRRWNYDLNWGQQIHAAMVRRTDVATIDLSDASDLVSLDLVHFLLPTNVFEKIIASRSAFIQMTPREWLKLNKVGSMGNGFTFELETLVFMAIARTFDQHASVYGDDIIVSRDVGPALLDFLPLCGLRVNREKSFCDGVVRESCGAFYVGNIEVTRFDFRWATSLFDCVVLRNKARRIAKFLDSINNREGDLFHRLSKSLSKHLLKADVQYGPVLQEDLSEIQWYQDRKTTSLGLFLETNDVRKWSTPVSTRALTTRKTLARAWQYRSQDICCVLADKWDPSLKIHYTVSENSGFALAVLLKTASLPTTYKRGSGTFRKDWVFFSKDGYLLRMGCFSKKEAETIAQLDLAHSGRSGLSLGSNA